MSIPMPIRSADRITIFSVLTLWFGIYAVLVGREADRHGVCPYMRPVGRIGINWVDGVSTYVGTDPEG